ncbi:PAS domain S-box protein [Actinoplanes friuliensis]|uniref:histidine kinase n=1 Tax=Actinoplanes friuliensis DSM 7358 TaxID=1246995 RepID=U5W1M3_9ACTN|nr:PAS domain S-box protein [Actinoplanes friuliensis]AGZ43103.1 putative multi-sensor signal transduction histidine kinase [Actinoplanes friuliensis DSM 7358]
MDSLDSLTGLLVDEAPDAVIICRSDGTIALANRRAHGMFGFPAGDLLGRNVDELVPDEIRKIHPGYRAGYLNSEHPPLRRLPLRGRRPDGSVFPVEVSLAAVAAPDGDTLVTAVLRDDTVHREAQEARALLASIIQSSHDAIVTTDLTGVVLTWNPGAEHLYGRTSAEMLGRPVDPIIPAERRVDEEEVRNLVRMGGRMDRYRTYRLHADGTTLAVSLLVSPLRDLDGTIVGMTTTARDVSDRERAEAQVQAVLDAAPDALLGVDDAGHVVLVNAEAERMFGYPRHDLTQMAVRRLLPDDLPAASAVLRTGGDSTPLDSERLTGAAGVPDWATRTARRRDGSELPVDISCSALDTGNGLIVVAAVRDITDRLAAQVEQESLREEAEQQKLEARFQRTQRLESLGQLAGGVAHDFNNLLAVILNYASFIVEDGRDTAFAKDAEQIARAARRGSDLTHQLLSFARREVIRPRALDVDTVVTEVHQMLQRSLGEHIALTIDTATDLPAVMADPGQLEQVLVNLAVNARDAMPGGGNLTIDTAAVEVDTEHAAGRSGLAAGSYVRIRVSDTGTGMPKDVIDKAFDPFFTTKPNGQGTGLGLATVYGIVTQAGGTVQIYSETGLGTTITVLLPVTDAEVRVPGPAEPAGTFSGQGTTVLVVEDETALREVTERILVRAGYTVLTAANGTEALKISGDRPVDILLTDVVMPGMLGKDIAEAIVAARPETRVLFMSGYAQPVLTTHGTLAADVHLLEKPFTSAELFKALHEQLSR